MAALRDSGGLFSQFFERSADAIFLFDPGTGVFSDCNQAAVDLLRCSNKEQVINLRPEEFSPER
jgi:PAS domain-containing protein